MAVLFSYCLKIRVICEICGFILQVVIGEICGKVCRREQTMRPDG